jgi:hypothetical protein
MMTRAEAWREIARRIEERGMDAGLCNEVLLLEEEGKLDTQSGDRMIYQQIQPYTYESGGTIYILTGERFGPKRQGVRILIALFCAIEAEEEDHA